MSSGRRNGISSRGIPSSSRTGSKTALILGVKTGLRLVVGTGTLGRQTTGQLVTANICSLSGQFMRHNADCSYQSTKMAATGFARRISGISTRLRSYEHRHLNRKNTIAS